MQEFGEFIHGVIHPVIDDKRRFSPARKNSGRQSSFYYSCRVMADRRGFLRIIKGFVTFVALKLGVFTC
jgi:hypothetical protein